MENSMRHLKKLKIELLCVCVLSHFSHVRLSATPMDYSQAPLSMRFSRQE